MFPHKDDLSPFRSIGLRQEMLTTGWTALKRCGEAGEFSLFKWQRKHSHYRANEPHFVFSHAYYPLRVCVPCVCWHTCMEAGEGHRVLFYFPCTEPGARRGPPASTPQHTCGHAWLFSGIFPSACWNLNTYIHACKSSCSPSHFFSPNINKSTNKHIS